MVEEWEIKIMMWIGVIICVHAGIRRIIRKIGIIKMMVLRIVRRKRLILICIIKRTVFVVVQR